MITEECHQEALAATCVPMYASRTSNIEVAPMPGVQFIDPAKYRSFLGINPFTTALFVLFAFGAILYGWGSNTSGHCKVII